MLRNLARTLAGWALRVRWVQGMHASDALELELANVRVDHDEFLLVEHLSGDGLERIQAMLSELREVAWLAGIVSILSILGIGVAGGVALVAFA
jgi:alkylation response protein AidB-like acyl-CoA dehydrogenase